VRTAPFCLWAFGLVTLHAHAASADEAKIDIHAFHVIPRESGPVDYYRVVEDPGGSFIRGQYSPPDETTVLGYEIPDDYRQRVATIRWRWRAVTLPRLGDECSSDRADSAAVVYITWKRGFKWYSLKYVWSAVGPKNATCDRKRNPFRAQDTIIVESGAPVGEWKSVEIDPDKAFRYHFEDGDPDAEVPKLVGIGIMSDGDQTNSPSSADYRDFSLVLR
jgi:Protein of unknown function (DUF3047)